jgi:hypothetical protein
MEATITTMSRERFWTEARLRALAARYVEEAQRGGRHGAVRRACTALDLPYRAAWRALDLWPEWLRYRERARAVSASAAPLRARLRRDPTSRDPLYRATVSAGEVIVRGYLVPNLPHLGRVGWVVTWPDSRLLPTVVVSTLAQARAIIQQECRP